MIGYLFQNLRLTSILYFRLFLSGLIVSIKTYEDYYYCNKIFSKIGGVDLKELNLLEKAFLNLIDFNTLINEELFDTIKNELDSNLDK